MGFRLSKYNLKESLKGYNNPLDQRNYDYWESLKIAIKEEIAAYWINQNNGQYKRVDLNNKE